MNSGGNLRVVGEVEVPETATEQAQPQIFEASTEPAPRTEPQSARSSGASPHLVELLAEIRRVLNARAGALLAMTGAFALTAAAMYSGTMMALYVSLSYDVLVFLPIAVIAYMKPKV